MRLMGAFRQSRSFATFSLDTVNQFAEFYEANFNDLAAAVERG